MLDQRLRFDAHVDHLCKNIWPKIMTLRRIRKYITTKTSLYMYKSLIEPCFTFNDFIYDPLTIHDQNRLQVLQNSCLRTCLQRGPLSHRADLFNDSNVLPLDVQRKVHCTHFVYRALNQESTRYLNNMYNKGNRNCGRMTQSTIKDKLTAPPCRTECANGNVRVRGARIYNEVSLEVRQSNNIRSFKRNLLNNMPFTSNYM